MGSSGISTGAVGAMGHDDTKEAYFSLRTIPNTTGVITDAYSGKYSVAITTATTTAVKALGGVVGSLANASEAVPDTITVYDNTSVSGTKRFGRVHWRQSKSCH